MWYAYCENNPLTNVDPTGEQIVAGHNDISNAALGAIGTETPSTTEINKNNCDVLGYKYAPTPLDYSTVGRDSKNNASISAAPSSVNYIDIIDYSVRGKALPKDEGGVQPDLTDFMLISGGIGLSRSLGVLIAGNEASEAARYAQYWENLAKTPGTLSNRTARAWYLSQEARIPGMLDASRPLEQQAQQAFNLRNTFRTAARDLMADRSLAAELARTDPNMTWGQMVQKYSSQGFNGDMLWNRIIQGSQSSRASVNTGLGF